MAIAIPIPSARRGFKNNLARFPIANLDGIDDARALLGGDNQPIHQPKDRFGKVDIKQRFGSRKLEDLPLLKEPVEAAFAQVEEPRPHAVGNGTGRQITLGRLLLRTRLLSAFLFRRRYMLLNRKEHMQAGAVAQSEQAVHHFVHRIFFHFLSAEQAVSASDASKEQSQVIEDLGRGSDSRARIAGGVLLLDGNGGRDPVDQIDVRLLNPL